MVRKLAVFVLVSSAMPAFAGPDIVFVLDASGSMWGQVDGVAKIATARNVLSGLLADLPEGARVGFVSYGDQREGDCDDVTVVSGLGKTSPGALATRLRDIQPKGKTPIARSLDRAGQLFAEGEGGQIVLVSDGIETCGGDPCATAEALATRGVDLRIHVVGFDVDDETREQLACVAEKGKGRYFDARDVAGFETAIAEVKQEVEEALVRVEVEALAHASAGGQGKATGVELTPGDVLTVRADAADTWSVGTDQPYSRESNAEGLREHYGPLASGGLSAPFGSLVGRLGAGPFFLVGTSYRGKVEEGGELFLYCWDDHSEDNSGSISVAIGVGPPGQDGLRAHWSFDSCDARDLVGRHHGTVHGDPECVEGMSGSALRFDGVDDHVVIEDGEAGNLTGDVSVVFWMKPASVEGRVLEKDRGQYWVVSLRPEGPVLWLRDEDQLGEPKAAIPVVPRDETADIVERWSFVAFVKRGDEFATFLDGEPVAVEATGMSSIVSSAPMVFGRSDYWKSQYFTGILDEVRLYDEALTEKEIQELYRLADRERSDG